MEQLIYRSIQTSKNGFIYGSRLRLAHSIVITLLFNSKKVPFDKKLKQILRNTFKHGELLLVFGFIFKLLKLALLKLQIVSKKKGLKELIAGLCGGFVVYSGLLDRFNHNGISQQVTLYCASRVMLAIGKKMALKLHTRGTTSVPVHTIENTSWLVFATLVWGSVMYLYETDQHLLQRSLVHSMHYIYDNDLSSQITSFFNSLFL